MQVDARKIIVEGDVNELLLTAQYWGKNFADQKLTTSQIRNVFGEIRRIGMLWASTGDEDHKRAYRDAVLLQPKLAYMVGRAKSQEKQRFEDLQNVLTPCLEMVRAAGTDENRHTYFTRFTDFFEAILAYHRASGGKDQ